MRRGHDCKEGSQTMRKFVLGVLAATVLVVGAAAAASAAANANDSQNVTVNIPEKVGIKLSPGSLSVDFSAYPPDNFPAYYGPSRTSAGSFTISVFSNKSTGYSVSVEGSGTLPTGVAWGDVYVTVNHSSEGANAPGRPVEGSSDTTGWTALSSNGAVSLWSKSSKTTGWDTYNADLMLKFDGDEETGNTSLTITYTITAGA